MGSCGGMSLFARLLDHFSRFVNGRPCAHLVPASLGLGLHIVREIVLAHGGTVSVKSTESEGTTFCVRLPRRAAASPSPEFKHADTHDATGVTVVAEAEPAAAN